MRTAIIALLSLSFSWVAFADDPSIPSPPFTIMQAGAPPIQLSQYKGKIVVLTFIHTTCSHCQAHTKSIAPLAHQYAAKGIQFVDCAFNDGADKLVAGFIETFQPGFPVGYSNLTAVRAYLTFSKMEQLMYVPHMVILDAKGVIRGDFPGESDFMKNPETNLRAELDKMLKAPVSAAAGTKKK
jgi:cytochrome oxidase Cu insertion factor (SCO1/SenC/PrrC family)